MPQTKIGSLTLSRVTDGVPGNTSTTHMAYQNAAAGTAPTLPTTSSIGSDGLLEDGDLDNSWTAAQATPTSSQVTWVTSRIFLQTAGTGNFVGQGSWTAAAQVSGSGGNSTFTASIFIRTNTPPTVAPSGTSSSYNFSTNVLSGVPTGFSAAIPTGTNPLYISSGTFSAAGTGTDTGVTWTVPALFAVQGTAGTRGPGRFDKSITLTGTAFPVVGADDYRDDVLELVCENIGGFWNATTDVSATTTGVCQISNTNTDAFVAGQPQAGDIAVITYTNSAGALATRGAIHDGSSINSDTAWIAFAVQIDGSLLVQGTVVADELTIGNNGEFFVDGNGNLTLRSLTVTSPSTVQIQNYNFNAAVNSTVGGSNDYICTRRDGCIITDLSVMPPAVNGWAVMGTARLAGVPSSYVGLDSEGQPQTFDSNGTTFTPATPTGDAVQINNDAIRIFDGGILRVVLGNLD